MPRLLLLLAVLVLLPSTAFAGTGESSSSVLSDAAESSPAITNQLGARSLDGSRMPFTGPDRWAGFTLVSNDSASGHERADLMVKLSMAQFHHLRAMHGITWSLVTLVTTPGIVVLGGALLIGGAISGAFTGDMGILIAGIVIAALAGAGFVISIPTLIGNLIQASASAARVEELRRELLRDDVAGLDGYSDPSRPAGVRFSFAF